ncbi:hypothetical protein [Paraburkholderia saeva]|uniref:hypothetical protein n=1 Tax=Paraburkholderia saeva TaxID=2777537 RepID=UPI001DA6B74F|nr:hypothetical protein [Paraburkholderia saeva]CAG4901146.1 hypothetical protein R52603_02818 [Paraburkholderia saeva]
MLTRHATTGPFEALPNPRGGIVRSAESALAEAQLAMVQREDPTASLLQGARALREAGWLAAHRFANALALASSMAQADAPHDDRHRAALSDALEIFRAAVGRHNLRELSCSPALFAHYRALGQQIAQNTPGYATTFEDMALAARPVPPVTLHARPASTLTRLRARYERALLPVLRAHHEGAPPPDIHGALDELDACLAEAAGPDPYDFWRLAGACAKALRAGGSATDASNSARHFYARCNLVFADHARGTPLAPRSLVRATLATLWRDYALFGASAEDADQVEVLHDYGLTVDWHVAGTQASEALWESEAAQAAQTDPAAVRTTRTRDLGVLTVNAHAYEDFLQTADATIVALSEHARQADNPEKADPSAALQAGDAAYRLGSAACALGLGHVALLADALGLAWRRRAHAGVTTPAVRSYTIVDAPDARSLDHAAEALRAMLHKIAAGVAPADSSAALAALTRAIELGGAPDPARAGAA